MTDLKTRLLDSGSKKEGFDRMLQECEYRVKRIRQRNDLLQKNAGTEQQQKIADEVVRYRDQMETDITELRDLIKKIEEKYKDPQSRKKLKVVRADATKQFERNKIIMREFIDRSYMLAEKHARSSVQSSQNSDRKSVRENQRQNQDGMPQPKGNQYSSEHKGSVKSAKGSKSYQPMPVPARPAYDPEYDRKKRFEDSEDENSSRNQQRQSIKEQQIDYQILEKLEKDKRELLEKAETDINRLNDVVRQIGLEVDEQGNNLNIISDQLMKANENVVQANAHMDDANELQKKARKRNVCILAAVLLLVVTAVGVILILKLI